MNKSLFKVSIEFDLYVWAEDDTEAVEIATGYEAQESILPCDYAYANQVTDSNQIAGDWKDSIPFGAPNDETCIQLYEFLNEDDPEEDDAPKDHPDQIRMFGEVE